MTRTWIKDIVHNAGEMVSLSGWVFVRRDHGKIIFIDLRDKTGVAQLVFLGKDKELFLRASMLRSEWVISIVGEVNTRPDGMVNHDIETGNYEVLVKECVILNEAQTPPFEIETDGLSVGEEVRMAYRYLDLRRARLHQNIEARSDVMKRVRDFLSEELFTEVETPVLGKSTPEGARDYLVPSRIYPGNFYALPQSPQQYKQLLMVGGMERYYQFARCFRDEDTRGDRQPEFTQLDMEMSFVEQEDVMALNEKLLIHLVQTAYPDKKIQEIPFPRLSYKDAMERYRTDRPDLRRDKQDPNLLAFCWVVDFPFFETTDTGGWTFTHNPFSAPKPEYMDNLLAKRNIGTIITSQYDIVLNGWEIGGGSIRNHTPAALRSVFEIMGFSEKQIQENFGHMLAAFSYGAPPHGGIAWGMDRLMMILQNEPNIREVIAFPKTGDAKDLMMHAPSGVTSEQLKELSLEIKTQKK
ncbi:MAG: aspartate--tRNA ligase [Patescibacteria group bacterium]|nr:aspartate--tRNA ligase [Patescibacteria group bacterium]MDE2437786.1 aspartate--tRNA ligase [Patescibacteria group bacterium]